MSRDETMPGQVNWIEYGGKRYQASGAPTLGEEILKVVSEGRHAWLGVVEVTVQGGRKESWLLVGPGIPIALVT